MYSANSVVALPRPSGRTESGLLWHAKPVCEHEQQNGLGRDDASGADCNRYSAAISQRSNEPAQHLVQAAIGPKFLTTGKSKEAQLFQAKPLKSLADRGAAQLFL